MFRNQYDSDVTVWSPQGRLHQVEYAMEAVKLGSATIGLKNKQFAVLIALKRAVSELSAYQKKIIPIDEHIGISISGLTADARMLSRFMRTECLNHKYAHDAPMPVGRLIGLVGNKMQICTQRYDKRPLGVGLLVAGYDDQGPHIYQTCPSANFFDCRAMAIGARSQSARTYLEKHLTAFPDCELQELVAHGLRALRDTLPNEMDLNNKVSSVNESTLLASYKVAYRVAKAGKPHTIAENLILPAALDMVEIMVGKQEANKLKSIPLSDNTISRRINDMADDIREQVVEKLKKSPHFALQFDESTDVSNCAQFVVFVRFEADDSITEEILFCKALPANTSGQCLYDMFLESTCDYDIDWKKCIAVCSDGAKAMTGKNSGLVAKLKSIMPNVSWTHCFLHRQALAAKVLPSDLNDVLNEVIKIVNSIKGKALQTRLFRIVCEDMGSLHHNLLYHTEVRWLSKGKVLIRVLELKAELLMFLQDSKSEYANHFSDPVWLLKLAFLADLFSHLNNLNKNLQGREENILTAKDKVKAFHAKLRLWSTSLQNNIFESFTCVQKTVEDNATDQSLVVRAHIPCMIQSLHNLQEKLLIYFPDLYSEADNGSRWILNPFLDQSIEMADLTTNIKENLIDIAADGMLKMEFHSQSVDVFWMKRKQEYPELAREALKLLVPFATSYLCELTFSSMVDIKTKKRNRLQLENDLIIKISKTEPRFNNFLKNKQAHPSH